MADVRNSSFMLSSATLMVAPAFTTDVFSLIPALHSVGMTNNVNCNVDSSIIELKNGIAQAPVDARRTAVSATISATVWELSAINITRAAALGGGSRAPIQAKRGILAAPLTAAATSISINSDPVPGDPNTAIMSLADVPAGSTIIIQRVNGEQDYVFPTIASGAAVGTGPYAVPIAGAWAIPANMSFAAGCHVWVVTPLPVASIDADDLYGVKITGTLSNFDRPVTIVFPKVRMVKGFHLDFTETAYGSMPWEMKPFLMSANEASAGRLSEIGTRAPGVVYVGA